MKLKFFTPAIMLLYLTSAAAAGTVAVSKQIFLKAEVRFLKNNFTASYGQTAGIIVKGSILELFDFSSVPAGVVTLSKGRPVGSSMLLVAQSMTSACSTHAVVTANFLASPIASIPGTILTPTIETMSKLPEQALCSELNISTNTYDHLDLWLATELSGSQSINLSNVIGQERVEVLTNTCGGFYASDLEYPGLVVTNAIKFPGAPPSGKNQWVDIIGFCGGQVPPSELPITNCSVTRSQLITVGACTVQTNTQTMTFDAMGNITTNRTP